MSKQIENINIFDKVALYVTSMWLLFFLIIIMKINIPIDFSANAEFIGWKSLLLKNIIPLIAVVFLGFGLLYSYSFNYKFRGTSPLQIKIKKLKNINYEQIIFLTTYIIPLVSLNLDDTRYLALLFALIIIIGIIFIKTDLYYANPTLSLLGYHIYQISGTRNNNGNKEKHTDLTVITRDKIQSSQEILLKRISDTIYYGKKP